MRLMHLPILFFIILLFFFGTQFLGYADDTNQGSLYIQLKIGRNVAQETLEFISRITEPREHIIEPGESVQEILQKYYGRANQKTKKLLLEENRFDNINMIYPGQEMKVPAGPLWLKNYETIIPADETITSEAAFFCETFGKETRMEFMNFAGNQHIINPDNIQAGTRVTLPRASLPVSFMIKPEMKNKLDQIEQELKKDPAVKWNIVRASRLVPHYTLRSISPLDESFQISKPIIGPEYEDDEVFKLLSEDLRDVTIAILDSGIAIESHSFPLWNNAGEVDMSEGYDDDYNWIVDDLHGADTVYHTAQINDNSNGFHEQSLNWHGTHVAGILTGRLLPNRWRKLMDKRFHLMVLRITEVNGDIPPHAVSNALHYARQKQAVVVNMSFTGDLDPATFNRIETNKDTLFVVAAGNGAQGEGVDLETRDIYPAKYCKRTPNVLVVAALETEKNRLAEFSNYGKDFVEIAVPGVGIVSTTGNGETSAESGTSQATPFVTRAAAILSGLGIKKSVLIKRRLIASADYVSELEEQVRFGAVLNFRKALQFRKDLVVLRSGEIISGDIHSPWSLQLETEEKPTPWGKVGKVVFDYQGQGTNKDMVLIAAENDRLEKKVSVLDFDEISILQNGSEKNIPVSSVTEIIPSTPLY